MPYKNPYNESIANQLRNIDQNHVNRINAISETNAYDVVTPMEHTTLHNPHITGGSGYAAATVQDLASSRPWGPRRERGARLREAWRRKARRREGLPPEALTRTPRPR